MIKCDEFTAVSEYHSCKSLGMKYKISCTIVTPHLGSQELSSVWTFEIQQFVWSFFASISLIFSIITESCWQSFDNYAKNIIS